MPELNLVSKADFNAKMQDLIDAVEAGNDLSDVHTVDQNTGDGWYKGDVYTGGTGLANAQKLAKESDVLDMVYNGRDDTKNTPHVMTWFNDVEHVNSLLDIPSWSICSILGEKFKELTPSFPDVAEIANNYTYYLETRESGTNANIKLYLLYRSPRTTVWAGYTSYNATTHVTTLNWNKIITPTDSTLTKDTVPADAKAVGDKLDTVESDIDTIKSKFIARTELSLENAVNIAGYVTNSGEWYKTNGERKGSSYVLAIADLAVIGVNKIAVRNKLSVNANVSFVKNLETLATAEPQFCTGETGRHTPPIGADAELIIPSDCTAIVIGHMSPSNVDATPHVFIYYDVDSVQDVDENDVAFEYYGDHSEPEMYWWTENGSMDVDSGTVKHSAFYQIRPNTEYYLTAPIIYKPSAESPYPCLGAFLDVEKKWIAPILSTDITYISPSYTGGANTYRPDQGADDAPDITNYPASKYLTFGKFKTPLNARYVSINICDDANSYLSTICSRRVFMLRGTGNFMLRKGDTALQKYANKKLCMIGPSSLMIDLLKRAGANNPSSSDQTYTAGQQEYIRPFFESVTAFGYSGAGYASDSWQRAYDYKCPIYYRICGTGTDNGEITFNLPGGTQRTYNCGKTGKDLSGYDVFVIYGSSNGLTLETVGEYTDDTETTYCGAIRNVIDKIYADNPKAEIHLVTFWHSGDSDVKEASNTQLRLLAENMSFGLIDADKESGINPTNFPEYKSSDTHLGNEGNRRVGLLLRKHLIGF